MRQFILSMAIAMAMTISFLPVSGSPFPEPQADSQGLARSSTRTGYSGQDAVRDGGIGATVGALWHAARNRFRGQGNSQATNQGRRNGPPNPINGPAPPVDAARQASARAAARAQLQNFNWAKLDAKQLIKIVQALLDRGKNSFFAAYYFWDDCITSKVSGHPR